MLAISSTAQEASVMQFTVMNTPPTVGPIACEYNSTLETALCQTQITDLNGYLDLIDCNGTLQQAGMQTKYYNNTCLLSDGAGSTITCRCSFKIQSSEGEFTAILTARDPVSYGQAEGKMSITAESKSRNEGLMQLTGRIVQENTPKAESKTTTTTTTISTSTTLAEHSPDDASLSQITGKAVQPQPNNLFSRLQELFSWLGF